MNIISYWQYIIVANRAPFLMARTLDCVSTLSVKHMDNSFMVKHNILSMTYISQITQLRSRNTQKKPP